MGEWISVEDNIPDIPISRTVSNLVVVGNSLSKFEIYIATLDREGSWCENATGCGCCAKDLNVTHWMPLPALPKVEDE